jgi:hypothetical protein
MKNIAVDLVSGWTEEEINKLELKYLHEIFNCHDGIGVEASIGYAKYLSEKVALNPDNYPVFMLLLQSGNHWVVDSLIGKNNPEEFFKPVQPNKFLLSECFKILTRWKRNGIYPKSLLVIFGLLRQAYENPAEGYRLYPLTISDLNNLGKHLDESKDQAYPVNKTILHLLDSYSKLVDVGVPTNDDGKLRISIQANNIRGKFLDMTKKLNEAIPDLLLEKGDYTSDEVAPAGGK